MNFSDSLRFPRCRMEWSICTAVRIVAVAIVCSSSGSQAQADLVKLMNGGELRGKIVHTAEAKQKIRLETLTGAIVIVERDQTQFVTMRSLLVEEYELDREDWLIPGRPTGNCRNGVASMACPKNGKLIWFASRNCRPNMKKPNWRWAESGIKEAGLIADELMASQGYVKYKNKYITSQELDIIQKTAEELELERGWFQKVRMWHGWLGGSSDDRSRKAVDELKNIEDPHAATAVIKFLCADSRVAVRELATTVLIKISGNKAVVGLVKLALFDDSSQVRDAALDGIGQDYYVQAQNDFIKGLKNEYNAVVCRAAMALGQIGDKKAVEPLIGALVTMHNYQVPMDVPNNQTFSFGTDGSFGSNSPALPPSVMAAVRTGQMLPPVMLPSADARRRNW